MGKEGEEYKKKMPIKETHQTGTTMGKWAGWAS
jgi:hypothetical protein